MEADHLREFDSLLPHDDREDELGEPSYTASDSAVDPESLFDEHTAWDDLLWESIEEDGDIPLDELLESGE